MLQENLVNSPNIRKDYCSSFSHVLRHLSKSIEKPNWMSIEHIVDAIYSFVCETQAHQLLSINFISEQRLLLLRSHQNSRNW